MEKGKYSALQEAHQRIKREQEAQSATAITDRQAEQGDRHAAGPTQEATDRGQRSTPAAPERRFPIPEEPAPNESEEHFRWRVRETESLERDWQRERRWEAVRKGHAPPTGHGEPQRESKPSSEADVEAGNE